MLKRGYDVYLTFMDDQGIDCIVRQGLRKYSKTSLFGKAKHLSRSIRMRIIIMRNIFDQYNQPENRLTHALVSCLAEDRRLLRRFVRWTTGKNHVGVNRLQIVEQQLPGERETTTEDEAERRGLPDAWIHDGESWSLVIESKVSAGLKNDQLRRHYRTAMRRGFEDVHLLALDVERPRRKIPEYASFRKWSEVYSWFVKESAKSEWARHLAKYMEAAENRMVSEGYLKEGTLTVFSGIPFDGNNSYNYHEAKRVLRLAMEQLRARRDLQNKMNIDPGIPGRPAITGKDTTAVWDFLSLKQSRGRSSFTSFPHFTLAIRQDNVFALVTVPNSIKTEYRRNLLKGDKEKFLRVFGEIQKNLGRSLKNVQGEIPWIELLQRHYPSQRSIPIVDARLAFDLRTAFDHGLRKGRTDKSVKTQPVWLDAAYHALSNKKANIQLAVGAIFPYTRCKAVNTPQIIDHIANTWIACRPLTKTMGLVK